MICIWSGVWGHHDLSNHHSGFCHACPGGWIPVPLFVRKHLTCTCAAPFIMQITWLVKVLFMFGLKRSTLSPCKHESDHSASILSWIWRTFTNCFLTETESFFKNFSVNQVETVTTYIIISHCSYSNRNMIFLHQKYNSCGLLHL